MNLVDHVINFRKLQRFNHVSFRNIWGLNLYLTYNCHIFSKLAWIVYIIGILMDVTDSLYKESFSVIKKNIPNAPSLSLPLSFSLSLSYFYIRQFDFELFYVTIMFLHSYIVFQWDVKTVSTKLIWTAVWQI